MLHYLQVCFALMNIRLSPQVRLLLRASQSAVLCDFLRVHYAPYGWHHAGVFWCMEADQIRAASCKVNMRCFLSCTAVKVPRRKSQ